MDITKSMNSEGADIFYDSDFRSVLEDHVPLLRDDAATEIVNVKSNVAYKFEYDLTGYLSSIDVPHYLHWITMRINGWKKDTEFFNPTMIRIPHRNSVNKIKQMFEATTTKK